MIKTIFSTILMFAWFTLIADFVHSQYQSDATEAKTAHLTQTLLDLCDNTFDAIKKEDSVALHHHLLAFYKETRNIPRSQLPVLERILATVRLDYMNDNAICRDIILLCDNALRSRRDLFTDHPGTLGAEDVADVHLLLGIFLDHLRYYEYDYVRSRERLWDPQYMTIKSGPTEKKRHSRAKQILALWRNVVSNYHNDESQAENLSQTIRTILGMYNMAGVRIYYTAFSKTREIENELERQQAFQIEKEEEEMRFNAEIEKLVHKKTYYEIQIALADIHKKYERKLITFLADLYSLDPENTAELRELLQEHEMSEEFTDAVFEELEKRQRSKQEENADAVTP